MAAAVAAAAAADKWQGGGGGAASVTQKHSDNVTTGHSVTPKKKHTIQATIPCFLDYPDEVASSECTVSCMPQQLLLLLLLTSTIIFIFNTHLASYPQPPPPPPNVTTWCFPPQIRHRQAKALVLPPNR